LDLNDTWVSDTGLQTLVGCKKLEALNLVGTRVTDQGMKAVSQITTLKSITLPTQTVRGAGMKELQQLPQLKFLTCWPTRNHWIYFARKRLAPDWNADDVSQLAELAAILLPRLDANGDGRVEMPDLEVTIGPDWRITAIGGIQDAIDGNEVTQTSLINSVLLYQDVAEDADRDDPEIRTGKATHFNWW
jgi:hypothetical protein